MLNNILNIKGLIAKAEETGKVEYMQVALSFRHKQARKISKTNLP